MSTPDVGDLDLLDMQHLADEAGVSVQSMRVYHQLSVNARRDGLAVQPGAKNAVPEPDYRFGQVPVWIRSTAQPWLDARA